MIVITTPTGQIGHLVLDNLLESGEALRVVARYPSAIPADIRERVEVVEGSHSDPAVVEGAFAGAEAVFWLTPADPQAPSIEAAFVGFTRPAAEALKRRGIKRVVGVSTLGRGTPWAGRAGFITGSLATDDLIAGSGVAYRALTTPSFMENIFWQVPAIARQGLFVSPVDGDRKLPSVATRDIAAAASRLLLDQNWTGFDEAPLLGPEDLSFNDMAEIMSDVLGKEDRLQQAPYDAYKERLITLGMSDPMAQGQTDTAWAKNEGVDNAVKRTPENSTPTSFRQWSAAVLKPAVLKETDSVAAS